MYVNFENFEKMMYYLRFYPVFRSKSSEKFGKKFGKSSEKFGNFGKISEISETGFSECSVISVIWKFRTFWKLRKNDVLFELRKFENIRSDSKTDPKVRLKVRNAGPYCKVLKIFSILITTMSKLNQVKLVQIRETIFRNVILI